MKNKDIDYKVNLWLKKNEKDNISFFYPFIGAGTFVDFFIAGSYFSLDIEVPNKYINFILDIPFKRKAWTNPYTFLKYNYFSPQLEIPRDRRTGSFFIGEDLLFPVYTSNFRQFYGCGEGLFYNNTWSYNMYNKFIKIIIEDLSLRNVLFERDKESDNNLIYLNILNYYQKLIISLRKNLLVVSRVLNKINIKNNNLKKNLNFKNLIRNLIFIKFLRSLRYPQKYAFWEKSKREEWSLLLDLAKSIEWYLKREKVLTLSVKNLNNKFFFFDYSKYMEYNLNFKVIERVFSTLMYKNDWENFFNLGGVIYNTQPLYHFGFYLLIKNDYESVDFLKNTVVNEPYMIYKSDLLKEKDIERFLKWNALLVFDKFVILKKKIQKGKIIKIMNIIRFEKKNDIYKYIVKFFYTNLIRYKKNFKFFYISNINKKKFKIFDNLIKTKIVKLIYSESMLINQHNNINKLIFYKKLIYLKKKLKYFLIKYYNKIFKSQLKKKEYKDVNIQFSNFNLFSNWLYKNKIKKLELRFNFLENSLRVINKHKKKNVK